MDNNSYSLIVFDCFLARNRARAASISTRLPSFPPLLRIFSMLITTPPACTASMLLEALLAPCPLWAVTADSSRPNGRRRLHRYILKKLGATEMEFIRCDPRRQERVMSMVWLWIRCKPEAGNVDILQLAQSRCYPRSLHHTDMPKVRPWAGYKLMVQDPFWIKTLFIHLESAGWWMNL